MPTDPSLVNDRVFWACEAVFIRSRNSTTSGGTDSPNGDFLYGVQSIGIDYNHEATALQDTGRFQRRYVTFGKPNFTINIERVITGNHRRNNEDGTTTLLSGGESDFFYQSASPSYEAGHLLHENNIGACGLSTGLRNYDITLVYASDDVEPAGGLAAANIRQATIYRCCLLTSISYSLDISGQLTETLSFTTHFAENTATTGYTFSIPNDDSDGDDVDDFRTGSSLKRKDFDFEYTELPEQVKRMFKLGNEVDEIEVYGIQSFDITLDIPYSDPMDVGKWRGSVDDIAEQNLFRQVELPIAVSASFTGIARSQYRNGIYGGSQVWNITDQNFSGMDGLETGGIEKYYTDEPLNIVLGKDEDQDETNDKFWQIDLGNRNYLTDISFSGGDTGGSNVEATLSFQNDFADFHIFSNIASVHTGIIASQIY